MKKISVFIISLLIILSTGCGASNNLNVKLSASKTYTPGKPYAMQIKINDKEGNPVEGAMVSANLNMKNMDHGTISVTAEDIGDGKYIGTADLPMNGDWVANIFVEHDGDKFEEEKQFSVEVKTAENAHKVSKDVTLPDFNLIDENGNKVSKQNLLGKTVVMTFTYVNCIDPNACPILLGNFSNLQQDLKSKGSNTDNLVLVSVSLDPENDTPEAMKEHAQKMNFDMAFVKLLTGDMSDIQKLTSTLEVNFEKKDNEVLHDNKTFIFNKNGKLTHEFTGSYIDRNELLQVVTANG
ncbi:electron transporter protein SCO1/SenC [Neobacillus bataviensis LMG 21833]|uniref:Electron transporter protein SCO1/SenC n=1 Tax=Neobacillus bataviensis LMG 21833 TaxID=1117379 RepID=K6DQX0_9BACI|nr:SCO family protein [Neobacillus bataviensis]EKN70598.1 electron transporter protein SCO1/SenC [Neobacillus bataviensis LMG 21833]